MVNSDVLILVWRILVAAEEPGHAQGRILGVVFFWGKGGIHKHSE